MTGNLATIQRYLIEGYASPSSEMDRRSAYRFIRGQIAETIEAWAAGRTFDCLVDIGSSAGFLTTRLKHLARRVIALDASPKALAAIGDPRIETIEDRLPELGRLPDASVDLAICTDTLYYLSDQDLAAAIERIHTMLRPGGFLIINGNEQIGRIAREAERHFPSATVLTSDRGLKPSPDFDRLFWLVESRYLFVKGLFRALRDPGFDREVGLSELTHRRTVRICIRHPWLEYGLWLAWPIRRLARVFWSNDRLLRAACVTEERRTLLWVYRRE